VSLVLDRSFRWPGYTDEATQAVCQVFDQLKESGAWVAGLWRLEVGNILEMGVRRGRHDAGFRDSTLADLALCRFGGSQTLWMVARYWATIVRVTGGAVTTVVLL